MENDFYAFVQPGWVSVWVGNFRNEEEFDAYLSEEFAGDFGFEIPFRAVREIGVESEPVEISKLVDGFSRSKTFDTKVVAAAETVGISKASCMLIIYNFAYSQSAELRTNTGIMFIGLVPFPGFD